MNDLLQDALVELAAKAEEHGISLTIGGGYGLVLKTRVIEASGEATLGTRREARATNDLDLFLPLEVMTSDEKARQFREILDELGYEPVENARYFQFVRQTVANGRAFTVKVDLLSPPTDEARVDGIRVRSRGFNRLHARVTEEAEGIYKATTVIELEGSHVQLPHPYQFLILKLHALSDCIEDPNASYGTNHAEDIYNTVVMLTEREYEEIDSLREDAVAEQRARQIIHELFPDATALGSIRVMETVRPDDDDFEIFLGALQGLFALPN